jgi:ribose transport system ATP-binding protein
MLTLQAIEKSFGATRAVRNVTLHARPGAVLGRVGENGAGKSSLMKIAGGIVSPDRGAVILDGIPMTGLTPRAALAHGIATVFQELTLVRSLSVSENLSILRPPSRPWRSIDGGQLRRSAQAVLDAYDVPVQADRMVGELSLGQQQMIEIVRAVSRHPKVLLLDEATAALGASEVRWLERIVAAERARKTIVLFISHRWDEITEFCQNVAIMRNGELVGEAAVQDMSHDGAVELMTGRRLGVAFLPKRAMAERRIVLEARGLGSTVLRGVSLELAAGEILGLGGLIGQGQDALLKSLFGDHPLRQGTILVDGRREDLYRPADAIRRRIAYVPQERKVEGLLLNKSVAFNLSLAVLRMLSRFGGLISPKAEARLVSGSITRLAIRTASASESVANLSGGNQQKVLLQKWLLTKPQILLLNDVTRGVDIATKTQIYDIVAELAVSGLGILLYSTDAHELVELAHRVLVMSDGQIKAELSGDALSAEAIVRASIGAEASNAFAA